MLAAADAARALWRLRVRAARADGVPGSSAAAEAGPAVLEEDDEEARQMAAIMGFSTFDSTAGKPVDDPRCKMEAVMKKDQRRYRQYMNRRGGFNRPLENV